MATREQHQKAETAPWPLLVQVCFLALCFLVLVCPYGPGFTFPPDHFCSLFHSKTPPPPPCTTLLKSSQENWVGVRAQFSLGVWVDFGSQITDPWWHSKRPADALYLGSRTDDGHALAQTWERQRRGGLSWLWEIQRDCTGHVGHIWTAWMLRDICP